VTEKILSPADARLLDLLQTDIPLTETPWAWLGEKTALPPAEVLRRVSRFRAEGLIRRLGGIFDSRRLGYRGTLCAFRVPAERVPAAAAVINSYTGVTHNYIRRHEYNIWCTLLAPGEAELARLTEEMRARVGGDKWLNLPVRRYFKVRVNFPLGTESVARTAGPAEDDGEEDACFTGERENAAAVAAGQTEFTREDKRLTAALQEALPLTERPYATLAAGLSRREEDVLAVLRLWREQGILKRVAAVLRHQLVGYSANALAVWRIRPQETEAAGRRLAARPEVTHCYERAVPSDWPYNMYTMLHAHSEEECRALALDLAELAGTEQYELLFSEAELKKSSMRYFLE
jgi:DNA-binding Lrp family transcriptional regulator